LRRAHQEMLARVEAKARAKEAEVQRKLEEQKAAALASWRRGQERDDAWRPAPKPDRPPDAKPEPWRSSAYTSVASLSASTPVTCSRTCSQK
jgi:hypothetical protein